MSVTETVSRDVIKTEVVEKFEQAAGESVNEDTHLEDDLGMGLTFRKALAVPLSRISEAHGGQPIGIEEAGGLKTVGSAIDLVHRRANGGT